MLVDDLALVDAMPLAIMVMMWACKFLCYFFCVCVSDTAFNGQTDMQISEMNPEKTGLEGFGQYPVFTMVFTGKYCPV